MNKKICSCGTCETAVLRAVEIIGKMTDDDECAAFAIAIGHALINIAGHVLADVDGQKLEAKGISGPLADILARAYVDDLEQGIGAKVNNYMTAPGTMVPVVDRLNVFISKMVARRKAEQNLPKD